MSDENKQDLSVNIWPQQALVEEAQRIWAEATGSAISAEEAHSVVLGIANLFDVVGVDRLAQAEDEE